MSIIFAIASLLLFPIPLAITAFILGIIATAKGNNAGIAGIILSILCGIFGTMFWAWIGFNLLS